MSTPGGVFTIGHRDDNVTQRFSAVRLSRGPGRAYAGAGRDRPRELGEAMLTGVADLSHRRGVRRSVLYLGVVAALAVPPAARAVAGQAQVTSPPGPGAAAAPCTPAALPTLGGGQGNAVAVSSNGLVVGYAEDSGGTPQPVLWQSGQVTRLSTGLVNVSPTGVNSRGEVVGTGVESATLDLVGWHWSGGKTTLLKAPAGTVAMPAAISDTGRIVGAVASDDDGAANPTSGEAPEQAASWASMNAPAKILPALAGDVGAHAYGVNKNGIAVGNSQASDHFTPVVWDAGGHVTRAAGSRWQLRDRPGHRRHRCRGRGRGPCQRRPRGRDLGHRPPPEESREGQGPQHPGHRPGPRARGGADPGAGGRWCRPAASRAVGRRGRRHDAATAVGRPRGGRQRGC